MEYVFVVLFPENTGMDTTSHFWQCAAVWSNWKLRFINWEELLWQMKQQQAFVRWVFMWEQEDKMRVICPVQTSGHTESPRWYAMLQFSEVLLWPSCIFISWPYVFPSLWKCVCELWLWLLWWQWLCHGNNFGWGWDGFMAMWLTNIRLWKIWRFASGVSPLIIDSYLVPQRSILYHPQS